MSPPPSERLVAILPCNDLDVSERFYGWLGFVRPKGNTAEGDTYRMLSNGKGASLHLTTAVEGWLVAGRNPFGLYLYERDVDALASTFGAEIIGGRVEHKAWGMYEFAVSDPDGTLVRVGWPSRLRDSGPNVDQPPPSTRR
jgi:predicted lactoylglutathione lyase